MIAARDLADLSGTRSLGVHALTGDRRGQLAMRLTGQMRLIFTVDEGTLIVEEVVDYHG
jgi:proteic killer suppression protein